MPTDRTRYFGRVFEANEKKLKSPKKDDFLTYFENGARVITKSGPQGQVSSFQHRSKVLILLKSVNSLLTRGGGCRVPPPLRMKSAILFEYRIENK